MEMLSDINHWLLLALFASGTIAFTISTISGGGGAMLQVPLLNFLIGVSKTAPVLNLGTFLGRPARLIIFRKHIHYEVILYYAPPAIIGAWIGGWLFANIKFGWLQILVGLFLVSTVFQYRFGKKERSFDMKLWYFIPLGFVISILGTVIGAMGPILNPFYLNLGLDKEDLIATKAANSFLLGLSQLGSYTFFGILDRELWIYGIALGIGATIGNIVGKRFLSRMKSQTFRQWLIVLMAISGILLIWGQLKQF
ncbi:MAG: sulfite exporter TauE/SafE family protein [Bacteroidetes bacterium]|nr:sulfite exporter TauE/SafE family protein [Bacteroidota bacterium]